MGAVVTRSETIRRVSRGNAAGGFAYAKKKKALCLKLERNHYEIFIGDIVRNNSSSG
jgi:hypothetical protein